MIATHTIKINGITYKAGAKLPEMGAETPAVEENKVEIPKRTRSKKNKASEE